MRLTRCIVRPAVMAALVGTLASPALARQQAPPPAPPAAPDALAALADEIAGEVAALRGWPFKSSVAKRRATPEEARRYIERRLDADLVPGRTALQQAMLQVVGLLPPSMDLRATLLGVLENQVGGYYDPDTKTLCLVERPGGAPAVADRLILVHELTHALDDQYVDLNQLMRAHSNQSEDMDLVVASISEGSATGLMVQYLARLQAAGRLDMKALQEYAQQEAERSQPLLDAPPYFSAMVASYICGMQFLAKGNLMALALAPDNKAFGESFLATVKNPPRSIEQILHPAKYWDFAALDEPVVVDDGSVRRWLARPGLHVVHSDTLGELLTAILAGPKDRRLDAAQLQLPGAWTSPAATGWGGDRFYLLAEGSSADEARRTLSGLRGVWVTAWDTTADRGEWLAALPASSLPAGRVVFPLGDRAAVVLLGFNERDSKALAGSLGDARLAFTQNGSAWMAAR